MTLSFLFLLRIYGYKSVRFINNPSETIGYVLIIEIFQIPFRRTIRPNSSDKIERDINERGVYKFSNRFFVFQIPIEVSIHSEVLEQVLNFWNLLQRIPTINLRYPQPDFY